MLIERCCSALPFPPSDRHADFSLLAAACSSPFLFFFVVFVAYAEPTSGLDSVTALSLITLLHGITRTGKCSMLISIHQPQAKLFQVRSEREKKKKKKKSITKQ